MKITIDTTAVRNVARGLGFSDRRLAAAMATAITQTAREVRQNWQQQIGGLDRPTALSVNAPQSTRATAAEPMSVVSLRSKVPRGTPPSEYLATQEQGGMRGVKKFEQALQAQGSMPRGWKAVPGSAAQLDGYGNINRGQLIQIISQLGTQYSPGYARVIGKTLAKRLAAAKRSGREYIAFPQRKGSIDPGVYQRDGRRLRAVLIFRPTVAYTKRLRLIEDGQRIAAASLQRNAQAAMQDHIRRLTEQGAR